MGQAINDKCVNIKYVSRQLQTSQTYHCEETVCSDFKDSCKSGKVLLVKNFLKI